MAELTKVKASHGGHLPPTELPQSFIKLLRGLTLRVCMFAFKPAYVSRRRIYFP